MKSLKELFLESKGMPVHFGEYTVIQMDRIPIGEGIIKIQFEGLARANNGVALKAAQGRILLSDNSETQLLHIWDDPQLPRSIEHRVTCPKGELLVWNLYQITHTTGIVTKDAWTNNAGMVVTAIDKNKRHYNCSDGIGDFDPTDFVFSIEWSRLSS